MIMPAMLMIMGVTVMVVRVHSDDVEHARSHAPFSANSVGKREDGLGGPFQHHAFQAAVVIEVKPDGSRSTR